MSTIRKNTITLLTRPGAEYPLAEVNGEIIGLSTDFDPEKCGINPIQKKVVKSKRRPLKKKGGKKRTKTMKKRKKMQKRKTMQKKKTRRIK